MACTPPRASPMPVGALIALAAVTLLWLLAPPLRAHELQPAIIDIDPDARTVAVRMNLEAALAGIGPEHADTDDAPEADRYDALRALEPEALTEAASGWLDGLLGDGPLVDDDGRSVPLALAGWRIEPVGDTRLARESLLRLTLPEPAAGSPLPPLRLRWPADLGPAILRVGDDFSQYVLAGDASDAVQLTGPAPRRTAGAVFVDYVRAGVIHIVPLGLDHILFVVGLCLLSLRWRPILLQVTAFTLAHSVTLALGTLGWVTLPARIVEPLIALSIVFIALENLLSDRLRPHRLALVFGFGLLHGLGFAGVLDDVGLERSELALSLLAFNAGVEIGQLCVVFACALLLWPFRHSIHLRRRVIVPASLALAATGAWWCLQRLTE